VRLQLRQSDLEWREVEGEIVALDLRDSSYLAINATGAPIWSVLATGCSREELIEILTSAHGIERGRAEADLERFLEELRAQDLLVEESGT
jgi:Coenzyme PQQ synthesis protein D (PqqD)